MKVAKPSERPENGADVEERENGGGPAPDFDAFFTRHERPLYAYLCRLLSS